MRPGRLGLFSDLGSTTGSDLDWERESDLDSDLDSGLDLDSDLDLELVLVSGREGAWVSDSLVSVSMAGFWAEAGAGTWREPRLTVANMSSEIQTNNDLNWPFCLYPTLDRMNSRSDLLKVVGYFLMASMKVKVLTLRLLASGGGMMRRIGRESYPMTLTEDPWFESL